MGKNPLIQAIFWVCVLSLASFLMMRDKPVNQPDGILAPVAPVQQEMLTKRNIGFYENRWTLSGLATYHIHARVLGTKDYFFDNTSEISPVDFALGWGAMSDNRTLETVSIKQDGRWYFVESRNNELSIKEIMSLSANTHMIPASEDIRRVLMKTKAGHLIEASGYLVEANSDSVDGWRSSTSRTDIGNNSCEVFLVQEITLFGAPGADGKHVILDRATAQEHNRSPEEPEASATAPAVARAEEPDGNAVEAMLNQMPSRMGAASETLTEETARAQRSLESATSGPGRAPANAPLEVAGDIVGFLESISVNGMGRRGAVINGRFCRINETIDFETGLRLAYVDTQQNYLHFIDDTGARYEKRVR